jgi:hypothetical protein
MAEIRFWQPIVCTLNIGCASESNTLWESSARSMPFLATTGALVPLLTLNSAVTMQSAAVQWNVECCDASCSGWPRLGVLPT